MKLLLLGDAIDLGRTLCSKPITFERHSSDGGACALGMADLAFGNGDWQYLPRFAWTQKRTSQPPPCRCRWYGNHGSVSLYIAHLNNYHVFGGDKTWTLDQLINWVRSIEPAESQEVPKEAAEVKSQEGVIT